MNTHDDLESIRKRVRALRRAGCKRLADLSGVPFSTVRKFAYGEVKEPGYETVRGMARVLEAAEAEMRQLTEAAA